MHSLESPYSDVENNNISEELTAFSTDLEEKSFPDLPVKITISRNKNHQVTSVQGRFTWIQEEAVAIRDLKELIIDQLVREDWKRIKNSLDMNKNKPLFPEYISEEEYKNLYKQSDYWESLCQNRGIAYYHDRLKPSTDATFLNKANSSVTFRFVKPVYHDTFPPNESHIEQWNLSFDYLLSKGKETQEAIVSNYRDAEDNRDSSGGLWTKFLTALLGDNQEAELERFYQSSPGRTDPIFYSYALYRAMKGWWTRKKVVSVSIQYASSHNILGDVYTTFWDVEGKDLIEWFASELRISDWNTNATTAKMLLDDSVTRKAFVDRLVADPQHAHTAFSSFVLDKGKEHDYGLGIVYTNNGRARKI